MKQKKPFYALYQGAVMCRVMAMTIEGKQRMATVLFDNAELAKVPCSELQMTFDLNEGREA